MQERSAALPLSPKGDSPRAVKLWTALRAYVQKLKAEHEGETVGKMSLGAVPLEVGSLIGTWIAHECRLPRHLLEAEGKAACDNLVKAGLLQPHPWGGYMVKQKDGAPPVPPPPNRAV